MVHEPQLGNYTYKTGYITEGSTQLDVFKFGLVQRELCYVCIVYAYSKFMWATEDYNAKDQKTSIFEPSRQQN